MADTPGPKPEILNAAVNAALAKGKANPTPSAVWDVVRQLGQGLLTVVSSGQQESQLSPTALPGELTGGQAVFALNSDKGPLLAAFTARNVQTLLPEDAPANVTEEPVPGWELARIASSPPYVGLAIDPGSENGMVIPAQFLQAGLPAGQINIEAKNFMSVANNMNDAQRQALIRALAVGPLYTAVDRNSLAGGTQQANFPLIPLGETDGQPHPETEVAIVFGTSPAEIAAVFTPEQWTPIKVRMNDVIATVRKSANAKLIIINPHGPTLQLPINTDAVDQANTQSAAAAAVPQADAATALPDDLLAEPTPPIGPSTEPDGGTREGED